MIRELLDATWPAAGMHRAGPWTIRDGQGGGSRVSAATAEGAVTPDMLRTAEQAMAALGQPAVVMVRDTGDALDLMLAAAGYVIRDPVLVYAAPVAGLAARDLPPRTAFHAWPPLAIQTEIWAAGGIGPARAAIMDRVQGPKVSLLGRLDDAPAGCAFVACLGGRCMLHALEVRPAHRRRGLARHLVIAAARWAAVQGAGELVLVVARANQPAQALYASLGLGVVGQYHYRIRP